MADKTQIELIASVPTDVKAQVVKIIDKNPNLKTIMDKLEKGLGSASDVDAAKKLLSQARKMLKDNIKEAPKMEVDAKGNVEVKDSWWGKKSTGVKAAIIGGAALILGLGAYAIIKAKKKK